MDFPTTDTSRLQVTGYKFFFLATIDVGEFLRPALSNAPKPVLEAHRSLAAARSEHQIKKWLFRSGDLASIPELSGFRDPVSEGNELGKRIEEEMKKPGGAKRIFTEIFLQQLSPLLFSAGEGEALGTGGNPVDLNLVRTGGGPVPLSSGTKMFYEGSRLRIFESGVIGIEFVFSFRTSRPDASIPVSTVITDLRELEGTFARRAAYQRLGAVFDALKRLKEDVWQEEWLPADRFYRLSSEHRIILVRGLRRGEDSSPVLAAHELLDEEDGLREVCGLCNRSEWYLKYVEKYVQGFAGKFIAYQEDEIFVTDGNSTFIYFPGYWDGGETHKALYIDCLRSAIGYLLSWESAARYFSGFVERVASASLGELRGSDSVQHCVDDLVLVRSVLFLLRDGSRCGNVVRHGFSERVLTQFLDERALTRRLDDISFKVDAASASMSERASHSHSDQTLAKQLRRQGWAIWVALFLGLAALSLNFCQARTDAGNSQALQRTLEEFNKRVDALLHVEYRSNGDPEVAGQGEAPADQNSSPNVPRGGTQQ